MNNSRSKFLVDIANSRNNFKCVSEAQDLINYYILIKLMRVGSNPNKYRYI